MRLRVKEGTQVVADRIYAGGEVFEVPSGFEDEAPKWIAAGYAEEVKARLRRKAS
jgi:hypothetical protein